MIQHYDTAQAANILGISPRTLERWRLEGKGPTFRKFGKRALYTELDLIEWSDAQRRTSTSDTGEEV